MSTKEVPIVQGEEVYEGFKDSQNQAKENDDQFKNREIKDEKEEKPEKAEKDENEQNYEDTENKRIHSEDLKLNDDINRENLINTIEKVNQPFFISSLDESKYQLNTQKKTISPSDDEYEKNMADVIKEKKYKEALNISIKRLEDLGIEGDQNLINIVKKNIIKLNNVSAMEHLKKGENEMSKYFLSMSDKSLFEDFETYILTKNNFSCYFCNIGQLRNSKNIMNDLLKITSMKKTEEVLNKNNSEDYSEIAGIYANISGIENKLKNYQDAYLDGMHSLALIQLSSINQKLKLKGNKDINLSSDNNLVMCYYNLGVQQEYLKRSADSQVSYRKSQSYSDKNNTDKLLLNKLKAIKIDKNNSINQINFKESINTNEISFIRSESNRLQEKIELLNKMNETKKIKNVFILIYSKNPFYILTKKKIENYSNKIKIVPNKFKVFKNMEVK